MMSTVKPLVLMIQSIKHGEDPRSCLSVLDSYQYNFESFHVTNEYDSFDEEVRDFFSSYPFNKRSRIVEMFTYHQLLFSLTNTGICSVYNKNSFKRLCFLNLNAEETIRSIFHNQLNQSILLVILETENKKTQLKCRSLPLLDIEQCSWSSTPKDFHFLSLFQTEKLEYPSYIEFDDVNKVIITYSQQEYRYCIWSMLDYTLLLTYQDPLIHEIKLGWNILILIYEVYKMEENHYTLPITMVDIQSPQNKVSVHINLKCGSRIDFIEQFDHYLMVKQKGKPVLLFDLFTKQAELFPLNRSISSSIFYFLYEQKKFLIFGLDKIDIWDFNGQFVHKIQKHPPSCQDYASECLFCTNSNQSILVYYYKDKDSKYTLCIYNIPLKKQVFQFQSLYTYPNDSIAIQGLSCMYFNETEQELYTGARSGMMYKWKTI